jgi:hypothetical protein
MKTDAIRIPAPIRYVVEKLLGTWRVETSGQRSAIFGTEREAIFSAMASADKTGCACEVAVHEADHSEPIVYRTLATGEI